MRLYLPITVNMGSTIAVRPQQTARIAKSASMESYLQLIGQTQLRKPSL